MSNGEVCCALQICCPPEEALVALANELEHDTGMEPEYCMKAAKSIQDNYDLAPKGTLQPLKDAIVDMVRKNQRKG